MVFSSPSALIFIEYMIILFPSLDFIVIQTWACDSNSYDIEIRFLGIRGTGSYSVTQDNLELMEIFLPQSFQILGL